jgi:protein N-terminal amidase
MQASLTPKKKVDLKIVIVQVHSVYGEAKKTYEEKVKKFLEPHKGKPIDFLVLPEMALTGYDFENREAVFPLCEEAGKGYHFEVAQEMAKEFNSYVVLGYPEVVKTEGEGADELFNSAYILDREGKLICNYRKILLYETDQRYFKEGSQEQRPVLELTTLAGETIKTGIGICMDINYKDFEDFWQFEMAEYCRDNQIELVLFPTAWTLQGEEEVDVERETKERDELYNYWTMRMLPHCSARWQLRKDVGARNESEWVFAAADRCGKERETCYKGLSCVMRFNQFGVKTPNEVVGTMGIKEEGALYVETSFNQRVKTN